MVFVTRCFQEFDTSGQMTEWKSWALLSGTLGFRTWPRLVRSVVAVEKERGLLGECFGLVDLDNGA